MIFKYVQVAQVRMHIVSQRAQPSSLPQGRTTLVWLASPTGSFPIPINDFGCVLRSSPVHWVLSHPKHWFLILCVTWFFRRCFLIPINDVSFVAYQLSAGCFLIGSSNNTKVMLKGACGILFLITFIILPPSLILLFLSNSNVSLSSSFFISLVSVY